MDEALSSTHKAIARFERDGKPSNLRQASNPVGLMNPYPTPSPSANGNACLFGDGQEAIAPKPLDLNRKVSEYKWPTPPYEESGIFALAASFSVRQTQ